MHHSDNLKSQANVPPSLQGTVRTLSGKSKSTVFMSFRALEERNSTKHLEIKFILHRKHTVLSTPIIAVYSENHTKSVS
jgi:hypothetical protein